MKTIRAVYEGGVFRPKGRVELPEHCEVEFEPRPVTEGDSETGVPDGDEDESWMSGIAREWAEEWGDPREDLYTIVDGEPIDEPR